MNCKIRMIALVPQRRLFGVMAIALATLLFQSTSAVAGTVTGSIAIGVANATTTPNDNVNTDTVFNLPTVFASGTGTGDFSGFNFPELLGSAILTTTTPDTFSFGSTAFGYFHGQSITSQLTGPLTEAFQITGTFTPGTDEPVGTTSNSASFTIGFTQNGGPGTVISASGTLNTPAPSSVPEPTSVVLGLCAVVAGGMFQVARRRKPTV
jgi:hypothetical protein